MALPAAGNLAPLREEAVLIAARDIALRADGGSSLRRNGVPCRLATGIRYLTSEGMEVHLSPEQGNAASQIATHVGTDAERLVK